MERKNKQKTLKGKILSTILDVGLIAAGFTGYIDFVNKSNMHFDASKNPPSNVKSFYEVKEQLDSFNNLPYSSRKSFDYLGARGTKVIEDAFDSTIEMYKKNLMDEELQTDISKWESFVNEQGSQAGKYCGLAFASLLIPSVVGAGRLANRFKRQINPSK